MFVRLRQPFVFVLVHNPRTNRGYKVMLMRANGEWHFDYDELFEVAHKCGCEPSELDIYY